MFDWDDVRYFLAVARTGSTLGAARQLRVNQTTTARRIAALERALELTLFERRQSGYQLTEDGHTLLAAAERMEAAAQALQDGVASRARSISGTVRLTTSEELAAVFLTPCLKEFRANYPDVRVEVVIEDRRLDIANGEADVALRAGSRPEGAHIVARRLAEIPWAIHCSHDYAARYGLPNTLDSLNEHRVIGGDGPTADFPALRWMAAMAPRATVDYRSNSLHNLIASVKAGLGIAALPCISCYQLTELVQCTPPIPEIASELWLITHEDLKDLSHVRAFTDCLVAHVKKAEPMIRGRLPGQFTADANAVPPAPAAEPGTGDPGSE